MRILYDNHVEDATITSYTEHSQMTWDDALKDTRKSRVGRSVGVDDEWIKFAFSGVVAASYCIIHAHNITAAATITIQGNASDSWGSPSLEETLTHDDVCYVNFNEASYQYWRLFIDDPTNTDGYIQISKIFLGTYLQMPGHNKAIKMPNNVTSVVTESPSNQAYGDKRIAYESAEFIFNDVTNTEKGQIDTFFEAVHNYKPYTMLVWESSLTTQLPVYVRNTVSQLNWQEEGYDGLYWNFTLGVKESG